MVWRSPIFVAVDFLQDAAWNVVKLDVIGIVLDAAGNYDVVDFAVDQAAADVNAALFWPELSDGGDANLVGLL